MEFWIALGDFFGTFEPKDWTTACLAIVALIVSIWTTSQTWRYHPRPLMQVVTAVYATDVEFHSESGTKHYLADVDLSRVNGGNGTALDVRVVARGPLLVGGLETRLGNIAPGQELDCLVNMFATDDSGSPSLASSSSVAKLTLFWSQSPRIRRRLSQEIPLEQ